MSNPVPAAADATLIRLDAVSKVFLTEEGLPRLRASIAAGECYCTNEIFLWPSITFQPLQLVRAMASSRGTIRPGAAVPAGV